MKLIAAHDRQQAERRGGDDHPFCHRVSKPSKIKPIKLGPIAIGSMRTQYVANLATLVQAVRPAHQALFYGVQTILRHLFFARHMASSLLRTDRGSLELARPCRTRPPA